jgi:hypothetical protein
VKQEKQKEAGRFLQIVLAALLATVVFFPAKMAGT